MKTEHLTVDQVAAAARAVMSYGASMGLGTADQFLLLERMAPKVQPTVSVVLVKPETGAAVTASPAAAEPQVQVTRKDTAPVEKATGSDFLSLMKRIYPEIDFTKPVGGADLGKVLRVDPKQLCQTLRNCGITRDVAGRSRPTRKFAKYFVMEGRRYFWRPEGLETMCQTIEAHRAR